MSRLQSEEPLEAIETEEPLHVGLDRVLVGGETVEPTPAWARPARRATRLVRWPLGWRPSEEKLAEAFPDAWVELKDEMPPLEGVDGGFALASGDSPIEVVQGFIKRLVRRQSDIDQSDGGNLITLAALQGRGRPARQACGRCGATDKALSGGRCFDGCSS